MFGDAHRSHSFEKLASVYEKAVESVRKETNGLRKRLKELETRKKEVQSMIDKVTKAKEDKVKELDLFYENVKNKLTQQLRAKLSTLDD